MGVDRIQVAQVGPCMSRLRGDLHDSSGRLVLCLPSGCLGALSFALAGVRKPVSYQPQPCFLASCAASQAFICLRAISKASGMRWV
jgi:hypothetical protein